MNHTVKFILNGLPVEVQVKSNEKLLDVLRDKLGVTSPKYGCGVGECGACTVHIDGMSVRSCITFAVEVEGKEVVTLEGLQENGPTEIQKAFIKHNAFQCGFCAPGFVMSATELIEKNPSPGEEEIRHALAGNLCRCTGYQNIVDAMNEVSAKNKEADK
ncbi:MAG: (2Fe-2S)-binding protein [Spirochaetes bacterium]|nr:MAG: (2Fe-2S)-binding protein [Spirochaetota bacterium]